jgi:site-specific DNA recombinase
LLKNRVYVGDLVHKDKYFPGEHSAIIDRGLFDRVQETIGSNAHQRRQHRINTGSLLSGRIYDDRGNRMTPTSAKKNGARYRYYASCALFQGRKDEAGSVARVPAPEVEALVLQTLREVGNAPADSSPIGDTMLVREPVGRTLDMVVVRKGSLEITYRGSDNTQSHSLLVPLSLPPTRVRRETLRPMDPR